MFENNKMKLMGYQLNYNCEKNLFSIMMAFFKGTFDCRLVFCVIMLQYWWVSKADSTNLVTSMSYSTSPNSAQSWYQLKINSNIVYILYYNKYPSFKTQWIIRDIRRILRIIENDHKSYEPPAADLTNMYR